MSGITRFHAEPETWQPGTTTPASAFTTEDHTERDHPFVVAEDSSVMTGIWECAPSLLEIDSYPVHEAMTVLAGSVTVTDHDNGTADSFTTGDTFFVEKGTRMTWEITQTLRKYYVITP